MTGEIADGWLGTSFMPEHARAFFGGRVLELVRAVSAERASDRRGATHG